jgi:hypothetical protein
VSSCLRSNSAASERLNVLPALNKHIAANTIANTTIDIKITMSPYHLSKNCAYPYAFLSNLCSARTAPSFQPPSNNISLLQLYETSDDVVDSKEEHIELKFELRLCNWSMKDYQELDDEHCETILWAIQEYVTVIAFTTSILFLQFGYSPDLPESAGLPIKVAGC